MKNTMTRDKSYLTWNEIRNSNWELVKRDVGHEHVCGLDYPNHLYDMNGRMLEVGQNIIRTTTGRHSGLKIGTIEEIIPPKLTYNLYSMPMGDTEIFKLYPDADRNTQKIKVKYHDGIIGRLNYAGEQVMIFDQESLAIGTK